MSRKKATTTEIIRLLFELERDDNPRLYDDLIRFNKGTKRVNRLRTLAQDGLLVQNMPAGSISQGSGNSFVLTTSSDEAIPFQKDRAAILNQVFEDPITE